MTNKTRYFLSYLTTRLGLGNFFASLRTRHDGLSFSQENLALSAQIRPSDGVSLPHGRPWRARSGAILELAFPHPVTVNTMVLRERASHCRKISLQKPVVQDGKEVWETFWQTDKVERYRYCAFPAQTVNKIRLCVEETLGTVTLTELSLYHVPKQVLPDFRRSAYLTLAPKDLLALDEGGRRALGRYFEVFNEVMLLTTFEWNKDGQLQFGRRGGPDQPEDRNVWDKSIQILREIIGDRDVHIIPTCINPGAETAYSLEHHMDSIIDQIVDYIVSENFYGVDFDWEFPKGKSEWALFNTFIVKIKKKLQAQGKILSICIADWGLHFSPEAVKAIDIISYMAYDIIDLNGYHSSFGRAAVRAVEYAEKQGFTRQQLNLGIPFYGRPTWEGEYWPLWKEADRKLGYWENYDPHIIYENIEMDSYYNSPGMVADKTAYAAALGLGGVMLYSITCDRPVGDPLCLADAVRRTLKERTTCLDSEQA